MSKPDTWMPWYVSDFLTKTTRLNDAETGAYALLLMHSWVEGGSLPDDDVDLSRMARTAPARWRGMRARIEPFFEIRAGRWWQKRLVAELEKATKVYGTKSANGKKGGRPRKQNVTEKEPAGFDSPKPIETQSQPKEQETKIKSKTKRTSAAPPPLPEWLDPVVWHRFLEHRDGMAEPMAEYAQMLAFKTLDGLRMQGQDPVAVIEKSIVARWTGLFPLKSSTPSAAAKGHDTRAAIAAAMYGPQEVTNAEPTDITAESQRLA